MVANRARFEVCAVAVEIEQRLFKFVYLVCFALGIVAEHLSAMFNALYKTAYSDVLNFKALTFVFFVPLLFVRFMECVEFLLQFFAVIRFRKQCGFVFCGILRADTLTEIRFYCKRIAKRVKSSEKISPFGFVFGVYEFSCRFCEFFALVADKC